MNQDAEDFIHNYAGCHGFLSQCRIRVFRPASRMTVVIATELSDNPGTSITHSCEELADQFYHLLGEPEGFVWIEHYLHEDENLPESYDVVEFEIRARTLYTPRWRRVSKSQAEQLIGQPLKK